MLYRSLGDYNHEFWSLQKQHFHLKIPQKKNSQQDPKVGYLREEGSARFGPKRWRSNSLSSQRNCVSTESGLRYKWWKETALQLHWHCKSDGERRKIHRKTLDFFLIILFLLHQKKKMIWLVSALQHQLSPGINPCFKWNGIIKLTWWREKLHFYVQKRLAGLFNSRIILFIGWKRVIFCRKVFWCLLPW